MSTCSDIKYVSYFSFHLQFCIDIVKPVLFLMSVSFCKFIARVWNQAKTDDTLVKANTEGELFLGGFTTEVQVKKKQLLAVLHLI